MPRPPLTREEDLTEQRNARVLRLAGGATLVLGGAGVVVGFGLGWPFEVGPAAFGVPAIMLAAGALSVRGGWLLTVREDPSLPTHAELPATDPRRANSLALRRAVWLLAAGLFVVGPAAGALAAWDLRHTASGAARLGAFLGGSYGAMALGLWALRVFNASRLWPRQ